MTTIIRFLITCALLGLIVMSEGCAGCSHRHRRARERHKERIEIRANYDSDDDDGRSRRDRRNRSKERSVGVRYSAENIQTLAAGEDYDAMLDAMFSKLNELRSLKNEYFRGDMPDKEVESRMKEIEEKYAPVEKALEQAQSDGLLTYNQHKRQMQLIADYMKEVNSVCNRLGFDLSAIMDM